MPAQDVRNSSLHFQLVPFLIGTALSILLCVGAVVIFNLFDENGVQKTFTSANREASTPSRVNLRHDSANNNFNKDPSTSLDLASIFELPTYFERSVALDDMLKSANLPTLLDLLEQSHNVLGLEMRRSTQDQIFRKFATLDPIQALSHAQSFPRVQYEHFASQIYREWSMIDLDASLAYAEQHVPTLGRSGQQVVLEQIFRVAWDFLDEAKLQIAARLAIHPDRANALLKNMEKDKPLDNPTQAWKEVLSVENFGDDESDQLLQIALVVIEMDGYAEFADLANSIQDRRIRTRLISRALSNRMDTDEMGTVFKHAVQLFHETARPVVFECAERWAQSDPLAALDAMSNVSNDQIRKHLEELAIETWIERRPLEVVQQLELLPLEYREKAQTEGIFSMSLRHPKEATEYLDKISDERLRMNVMTNLLQNWALRDIEEAFTWFLDNPDLEIPKGNSRSMLLDSLLSRVAPENAPSLIELALKYPVDETGSGWEGSIVGWLAYKDRTKAKALLPQVREGPGRFNAYVLIGLAMFRIDQNMNSVIELTEQLPADEHAEFFSEILGRSFLQEAYEQIDKLPTPEAQARAALRLLQKAATVPNTYTDQQIDNLKSFLTDKERTEFGIE